MELLAIFAAIIIASGIDRKKLWDFINADHDNEFK